MTEELATQAWFVQVKTSEATPALIDFGAELWEVSRSGNEHRKFVPTNTYKTADGYFYMAIGSDVQWKRITELPRFQSLASPLRETNNGRIQDRVALKADIAAICAKYSTEEIQADLRAATIPNSRINTVAQVRDLEALRDRLTTTTTPAGKKVRMQPMAVERAGTPHDYPFPPKYGEHTQPILREAGFTEAELRALAAAGVIP